MGRADSGRVDFKKVKEWEYRDTSYIPTKSAVVGLIACAMGILRGDKRIVELSKSLRMAVRVDRQGELLTDYQIVNGYHTPVESYIKGGSTKKRSNKIANKDYLQDAAFTVVLEGEEWVLQNCLNALKAPKYQVFLGRKSCVPCRPVFDNIYYRYNSIEDCIEKHPLIKRHDNGFLVYELEDVNGNKYRYDETKGMVAMKYDLRKVSIGYVNSENIEEEKIR